MVASSPGHVPGRRRRPPARAAFALLVALLPGCNFVPKSRVDDCQRVTQTLRSENDRLKDEALTLRTQNQDLSQRAVDDSRRLSLQEEAVTRLEKSVTAYQSERDKLGDAFETLKRQAQQAAAHPHPTAARAEPVAPGPLEAFAAAHPGWAFDPARATLSVAADRLFEPGSKTLRVEGAADLAGLAGAWNGSSAAETLEVSAPGEAPQVVRAGLDAQADADAARRFLAATRAARVREALLGAGGFDPARVRTRPADDGRLVVIRAFPAAPATVGSLDSGPSRDK